ncbi:MAG: helix-turn-helix transcriptional regulator [Spirochaetaceae bacterium]|nr:helix-turn-helix transcriptional regulator [Spirochaetaceae bacterium]
MKSELTYSGMTAKELSARSGVNKYSIDNYLNARGQVPSAEAAVRIARVLGVSVEYLVTGEEASPPPALRVPAGEAHAIARFAEQLTEADRKFALEFIKWMKDRAESVAKRRPFR